MTPPMTRRNLLAAGAGLAAAAGFSRADEPKAQSEFRFCLNTSTVRDNGKPRPIIELIDIAAKAGYAGIEPWISELDAYVKTGGTLKDLKKRIADAGLVVPDAIGFPEWIVDDPVRRKRGFETAKRDMAMVAELGGTHLAAPPVGATGGQSPRDDPKASQSGLNLIAAAERYRDLVALGKSLGITPIVEVWGFSRNVSRLGEALLIAVESGSTGGCVLPDVYHLYKGGSDFAGLTLLSPRSIGIFHVNDYPNIERGKIVDADRVYPGDGIAPVGDVFRTLRTIGYRGFVSLELFNREYWKQDPHLVARTGLEKLKAIAAKSQS